MLSRLSRRSHQLCDFDKLVQRMDEFAFTMIKFEAKKMLTSFNSSRHLGNSLSNANQQSQPREILASIIKPLLMIDQTRIKTLV